ncbi:Nance-Horan syndrome protein [Tachysurus fulvidraco]|uniref:Nance-Horan syndrome protein n=1 Tax=Tachysurus fulvidraco TaxID=1234273 RepID=UPI001FED44D7|nr:Nance-Horan syndrome protein [Tachysurus fulvidraco]
MPFAKRTVEPQRLCRSASPPALTEDLRALSNAALSRTVRQLSDVARHADSLFHELERELASTDRRLRDLREKVRRVERSTGELDHRQEAVPVSSLDVESKLSEHFQSVWQLQRNAFVPSSRPPCVEELHHNAKQSLSALHRDQQQRQDVSERERRVTLLIAPPTPTSPSHQKLHTFESVRSSSPTECCHFSRWSRQVDSDPDYVSLGHRSKFPIPNIPSPLDTQTNWSVTLPLPTPEDRMKSQSQAIVSCVVPIDVTGAGFDRDASVRCSLVYSQSVLQRRRKLRRRKTITGIPRPVCQDLDSDESAVASEQTVLVHSSPETCQKDLTLTCLNTRDSGCQTEDFLIAVVAPSRRRIRAQRGQSATFPLSHSTGNIPSLPDSSDTMFHATSISSHLRSQSLPREGTRLFDKVQILSDNDEEEDRDLSSFEGEKFLLVPGEDMLKDEESTDDQVQIDTQLGSFNQHPESPEHVWMQRGRSCLPCKTDEMSSSSDTFSSPIHSNAGVLASQLDHREDHQSSSGNWSGSSSTCPSQTSETIPPAASPPLTHCDSELSLNTALNITEESAEPYSGGSLQGIGGHRTGSFASTVTEMLDDAGVSNANEAEWSYPQHKDNRSCLNFSLEHSRDGESCLECPSFVSIATIDSLDKPPSDKADTTSYFSVDAEGYFTSMHFDCGLKGSKSFTYNYASVDQPKEEYKGHASNGRHRHSLRKPKVKPSPPERCSSLKKTSSHDGLAPETSKPKITNEQNLPVSSNDRDFLLAASDPSDQPEGEQMLEASDGQISNQIPDVALLGSTDKQSVKNNVSVKSDYADPWLVNALKSNDTYATLSNSSTATGTTVSECRRSQESLESQSGSRATTPSLPPGESEFRLPSPEKLVNLASPSSGYSSQSETPTSSSAFFPNPNALSPTGGKRKPKVPERKSSLTSVQKRTSKKDLELPIIPPTHLNLSAFHNGKKPFTPRNHIRILNDSKYKVAVAENVESGNTVPLEITPMMLHSVQLRSVSKPDEENHNLLCTDASTRPKRPTISKLNETRKPPPYRLLTSEFLSQDNCEPLFTPTDEQEFVSKPRISFTRNRFDRIAPTHLWSVNTFSSSSEQVSRDNMMADISKGQKLPAEPEEPFPQISMGTEKDQEVTLEATEENPKTESPPDHDVRIPTRSEKFDQVPDLILHSSQDSSDIDPISNNSNHGEESVSSGGVTRSASQETVGEASTPDTEDYFSKESTTSDPVVSPLTDESTTEDDSVFLSPSKARTTEDLFAMIHRSKRKVLGRKDSKGDSAVRTSLGASPATSPSAPVTPSSLRAPSQIYRSVKKSNTSNEEFKQLLLKRGSRSDSSYRISATEILKSPIASRTFGDTLSEDAKHPEGFPSPFQPHSPEKSVEVLHSPYPKANVEGFSTKVFSSSRSGRSRLPPASNSSRYSTRSRLFTTPMQAISEGETENSDGSPHDDRSS